MYRFLLTIILFVASFNLVGAQSPNPVVNRISAQEIAECKTPAAVAYNFVKACLNKDKQRIIALSTPEWQQLLREDYSSFIGQFSDPDEPKLYIDSWLPIPSGCEIAVLFVQTENYSNVAPGTLKKVYINVVPSSEIGNTGFQDITRMFNTNVKVMVENINGKWMASGFK